MFYFSKHKVLRLSLFCFVKKYTSTSDLLIVMFCQFFFTYGCDRILRILKTLSFASLVPVILEVMHFVETQGFRIEEEEKMLCILKKLYSSEHLLKC